MPLPTLDATGFMPLGPYYGEWAEASVYQGHDCSLEDVENCFVTGFPESITRAKLFHELKNLLALAEAHLECFQLLVTGEFVTGSTDPEDIFIVLDVLGEELKRAGPLVIWEFDRVFNAQEFKVGESTELRVQTYLVRAYPPDHVRHTHGYHERMLAMSFAGHPIPDVDAGYAEVLVCEGRLEELASIFQAPTV